MIGKRLKFLRNKMKISQYELASRLNLTRGQIANYEQGKRQPDYETLSKFADFFDVTSDFMLGRSDDPNLTEKEEIQKESDIKKALKKIESLPGEDQKAIESYIDFIIQKNKDGEN